MPPRERRPAAVLAGLVQPDGYTCGAATVVAARALRDPAYAARLRGPDAWRTEVLTAHREVRRLRDPAVTGAAALPWPRLLGTPPWAVARRLTATSGRRWRSVPVLPWRRTTALAALRATVGAGEPVPVFVGSRVLARHVVLAVGTTSDGLRAWDPATGRTTTVDDEAFTAARLGLGRWQVPWALVLPRP